MWLGKVSSSDENITYGCFWPNPGERERDTRELFSIKIINTDEMYWLAFRRKINFFTVSEICIFESTQPAGS